MPLYIVSAKNIKEAYDKTVKNKDNLIGLGD